jgi:outer membrane protein assembly factor BamD
MRVRQRTAIVGADLPEADGSGRSFEPARPASGAVLWAVLAVAIMGLACAGTKKPDKLTQELLSQPKEVLFQKGKDLIARKKYQLGRKYLNFVFESYSNDPLGRQALLLVADSYFKEATVTAYLEARYRYKSYLDRYPGANNRDYAYFQYAQCFDKEHEKADRDQTNTRQAIEQYQALIREYPESPYASMGKTRLQGLTDLLAEHEFLVGLFYLHKGDASAAMSRFIVAEQGYPTYSERDKLYYYEGLALRKLDRKDESRHYFERLSGDFPDSSYSRLARKKGYLPASAEPARARAAVDSRPKSE